jgi:hypothetical protein
MLVFQLGSGPTTSIGAIPENIRRLQDAAASHGTCRRPCMQLWPSAEHGSVLGTPQCRRLRRPSAVYGSVEQANALTYTLFYSTRITHASLLSSPLNQVRPNVVWHCFHHLFARCVYIKSLLYSGWPCKKSYAKTMAIVIWKVRHVAMSCVEAN